MALQKSIVSIRTGQTLGYHEILQASFGGGHANIIVASYVDKAAKDSGKTFADVNPTMVDYAEEAMASGVIAWAQAQLMATPQYQGATVVA